LPPPGSPSPTRPRWRTSPGPSFRRCGITRVRAVQRTNEGSPARWKLKEAANRGGLTLFQSPPARVSGEPNSPFSQPNTMADSRGSGRPQPKHWNVRGLTKSGWVVAVEYIRPCLAPFLAQKTFPKNDRSWRKADVRRDSADVKTVMSVKEHRALSLTVYLGAAAIILIKVATLVLATTTPATISHPPVPPSQGPLSTVTTKRTIGFFQIDME
jgi:hypothetical protein